MAGLLAADVEALLAHPLDDVSVADRGALERQPKARQMPLQAKVRHHRRNNAGLGETALVAPALGDHGHYLVAVDHVALFVDDDHPVGVAVKRNPDIRPHFAHLA